MHTNIHTVTYVYKIMYTFTYAHTTPNLAEFSSYDSNTSNGNSNNKNTEQKNHKCSKSKNTN